MLMGIKRDYALLRALAERIRITIATCTVYIQCKLPKKKQQKNPLWLTNNRPPYFRVALEVMYWGAK